MRSILPAFTTELAHARAVAQGAGKHFGRHYFSGDVACPKEMNRHAAQAVALFMLLSGLLLLALMRDLVRA